MKFTIVCALAFLLQYSHALNILISLSNLWVSKNTRFLQEHLEESGHRVVLVAPAYNHGSTDKKNANSFSPKRSYSGIVETREMSNGGDFGHLLEVNKRYFSRMRPRGFISSEDVKVSDVENRVDSKQIVQNKYFGQDPMNRDAWYVNLSPLLSLLIAFDVILPKYYPEFQADLVIIGPEEGTYTTPALTTKSRILGEQVTNLEEMAQLLMAKNLTAMSFSIEDEAHIYFQNEMYFPANRNHLRFRGHRHRVMKSIRFVNEKVQELINKVNSTKGLHHEGKAFWLNVNIPSINTENSRCYTSRRHPEKNPEFKLISFVEEDARIVRLPKFELNEAGDLEVHGEYGLNVDNQEISFPTLLQQDRPDYIDTSSYYYMYKTDTEKRGAANYQDYSDNDDFRKHLSTNDMENGVVYNCGISVVANSLDKRGMVDFINFD